MRKLKPYPTWVCLSCGMKYGRRKPGDGATWHYDECGVCEKWQSVTEPRDFGHLDLRELEAGK